MKGRRRLSFTALVLLVLTVSSCAAKPAVKSNDKIKETLGVMKIVSPVFEPNMAIPQEFTCQGEDVNPPLSISGVPAGAESLVLIVDDPDAPGKTWDHWLLWNIDPATSVIEKNFPPPGAVQGENSWGRNDYGGPCPPQGQHRYYFKLYALSERLNLSPNSDKEDLLAAMKGKILDQAVLIGLYQKS